MEIFLGFMFICFVVGVILIVYGESKGIKSGTPVQQGSVRTYPDNKRKSDISEPVISIVKSLKERGRWKITDQAHPLSSTAWYGRYSFTAVDTVTGESYSLSATGQHYLTKWSYRNWVVFPKGLDQFSLPSWMNESERKYVCDEFDKISYRVAERFKVVEDRQRTKDEKQAKVNQDKERQRLMNLYCKEKTE